jgi:hypothetical protein
VSDEKNTKKENKKPIHVDIKNEEDNSLDSNENINIGIPPETIAQLFKSINTIISPINNALQTISQSIDWDFYTNLGETAIKIANSMSSIGPAFLNWVEAMHKYEIALMELGWVSPSDFDTALSKRIIELFERRGKFAQREVDNLFLKIYTNDVIKDLTDSWWEYPFIQKRKIILQKCIEAHLQGNYELSIPVLMIQAEGICADPMDYKGYIKPAIFKEDVKREYFDNDYNNPFMKFFDKVWNKNFYYNSNRTIESNRNAILHGHDLNYANKKNSLRLIFFIDFMIVKISFKPSENSA